MNLKRRISLTISVLLVLVACFGLFIYEDAQAATIGATTASLSTPNYTVGSEYSGVITKQYVNEGDQVKAGQKLFAIQSTQLLAAINSGYLSNTSLPGQLSSDGSLTLVASHSGVVNNIYFLAGSFVPGGQNIATIQSTDGLKVQAKFALSGPEYARLSTNTQLAVSFAGAVKTVAITGVNQQSIAGQTVTIVDASLPNVPAQQSIFASGNTVSAHLILTKHTLYQRILSDIK